MNKNKYIYEHDFGYGKEGASKLNKLLLRDETDCKDYVSDICHNCFKAKYKKNILTFEDGTSFQVEFTLNK